MLAWFPLLYGRSFVLVSADLRQMPQSYAWHTYSDWGKTYGPLTYLNVAGKPFLIINSHEAAIDLLDRKASIYSDRPRFVMAAELSGTFFFFLVRLARASVMVRSLTTFTSLISRRLRLSYPCPPIRSNVEEAPQAAVTRLAPPGRSEGLCAAAAAHHPPVRQVVVGYSG